MFLFEVTVSVAINEQRVRRHCPDCNAIVVGSPGAWHNSGAAYVFVQQQGIWTYDTKLVASDGDLGDQFGDSVGISGDIEPTVVVGSYLDDHNGNNSGSAYVFVRNGGNWSLQSKISAIDGAQGDQYGTEVAIYGDTLVVNAPESDTGSEVEDMNGSAYVFHRNGEDWVQHYKFSGVDGLGCRIGLYENTLIAAACVSDDARGDVGDVYMMSTADTPPIPPTAPATTSSTSTANVSDIDTDEFYPLRIFDQIQLTSACCFV